MFGVVGFAGMLLCICCVLWVLVCMFDLGFFGGCYAVSVTEMLFLVVAFEMCCWKVLFLF